MGYKSDKKEKEKEIAYAAAPFADVKRKIHTHYNIVLFIILQGGGCMCCATRDHIRMGTIITIIIKENS